MQKNKLTLPDNNNARLYSQDLDRLWDLRKGKEIHADTIHRLIVFYEEHHLEENQ